MTPSSSDRDFFNQIRSAARGAPRTIAEGFGRFRSADFARYLEYARASLLETQNHLDDALDLKYLTSEQHADLFKLADRAIGATTKLHQYLKGSRQAPGHSEPGTQNPEPRTKNER